MDLKKLSFGILGYGNQGRAHALNLRDSGMSVYVAARPGKGHEQAVKDGFSVFSFQEVAEKCEVLAFLLPDLVSPEVYRELLPILKKTPKYIGFAHGFAYTYKLIERLDSCSYFLVGPKGAGAILRDNFVKGGGLPAVYAYTGKAKEIAEGYAKAIGCAGNYLLETTFEEETYCDLFGEQTVLCGGIMQLMESAFQTLVKNGMKPEMAFFECCYEARMITELWMKFGPKGFAENISPTAFYGGLTRGQSLIDENAKEKMQTMFDEVKSGKFAEEFKREFDKGSPLLEAEKKRLKESLVEKTYQSILKEMK